MKTLYEKLFNNRFVTQKKRVSEEKMALTEQIFGDLNVKELVDLVDSEFKNDKGAYTSSSALTIVSRLNNFEMNLFRFRTHVFDLAEALKNQISESEKLNQADAQKLKQQREAFRLEARYDWYGKFRTFLFSVMGAVLFIVTLFTIGYIEKNYDWAVLPLAKYVEVSSEKLNDTHQVSELKLTNLGTESPAVVEKLGKPIDKAISGNE